MILGWWLSLAEGFWMFDEILSGDMEQRLQNKKMCR